MRMRMSLSQPNSADLPSTITPDTPRFSSKAKSDRRPSFPAPTQVRAAAFGGLGKAIEGVITKGPLDKGLSWLEKQPRGIELLVEDILGFAVLRSVLDTMRGIFYGTGELSWSAGRERILRESLSVFTDLFIPGIVALGLGKLLDKSNGGFSSKFNSVGHLNLFHDVLKKDKPTTPKAFLNHLANQLATALPHEKSHKTPTAKAEQLSRILVQPMDKVLTAEVISSELAKGSGKLPPQATKMVQKALANGPGGLPPSSTALQNTLGKLGMAKPQKVAKALRGKYIDAIGMQLARALDFKQLDVTIGKRHINLKALADDWLAMVDELPAKIHEGKALASKPGAKVFDREIIQKFVRRTSRNRGFQLLALVAGLGATALAPIINHRITKKLDNSNDYPALRGLYKKPHESKGKSEKYQSWLNSLGSDTRKAVEDNAPFVMEALGEGNPMPLVGSLLPLVVAAGFFDTVNRRFRFPFNGRFKQLYDYGKVFPHVAQQQIASLYAILIGSRLFSARVDHEYYERVIDSVAGFSIWILGTPFLKQVFSMGMGAFDSERGGDNPLIKKVGQYGRRTLKSAADVDLMDVSKAQKDKLKPKLQLAGRGALISNIIILGLVEPLFAIFMTKWRSEKQQQTAWKKMYKTINPLEPVAQQAQLATAKTARA